MERKIIYFDLDGVMCDFVKMRDLKLSENLHMPFPQVQVEFWTELEPIDGALEAYKRLSKNFDVGILTAPSVNYPPTPRAMGWASGVITPTNVGSSS